MIIIFSIAAVACTFLGGLFALRFKDHLHLILGFSAGAVLGVTFFDLLPEALALGGERYGVSIITGTVALGFAAFMILDRLVSLHPHNEDEAGRRGALGASSLTLHSFLDGMAIGLAFQVSSVVGAIVAAAVLAHKFSDGINTVSLILKNDGTPKQAFGWLMFAAAAPVFGAAATLLFSLPEEFLGIILALFCGFFLYIGASDLLPESHHRHPTFWTTVATIVGGIVLYIAITITS